MALLRLRFPTMYPLDLARAIDKSGGMSMGIVEMQPNGVSNTHDPLRCRPAATLKVAGDERTCGSAQREPADLVRADQELGKRLDSTPTLASRWAAISPIIIIR